MYLFARAERRKAALNLAVNSPRGQPPKPQSGRRNTLQLDSQEFSPPVEIHLDSCESSYHHVAVTSRFYKADPLPWWFGSRENGAAGISEAGLLEMIGAIDEG